MKKLLLTMAIIAITCMSLLTSCKKSNAALIEEYGKIGKEMVEATEKGELTKIATLSQKLAKIVQELNERDLSDEEISKFYEVQAEFGTGVASSALNGAANFMESAANAAEKISNAAERLSNLDGESDE